MDNATLFDDSTEEVQQQVERDMEAFKNLPFKVKQMMHQEVMEENRI